jgi:hypothetical protein
MAIVWDDKLKRNLLDIGSALTCSWIPTRDQEARSIMAAQRSGWGWMLGWVFGGGGFRLNYNFKVI